jgi:hypothetical protein
LSAVSLGIILVAMSKLSRSCVPALVLLVLLATVVRAPALYFCPQMGALPKPCCSEKAPDRMGGGCCNLVSVDESRFQASTVTIPALSVSSDSVPALVVTGAESDLPGTPEAVAARDRDTGRSSPPSLYLINSSFLC